jgi:hypothetical protein
MGVRVLAMANHINEYPTEVSDIVDILMDLKNNNEAHGPVNDELRGWIDDRLTIFANFPHLRPQLAERLHSETREQIGFLLKNRTKVPHIRPKQIHT